MFGAPDRQSGGERLAPRIGEEKAMRAAVFFIEARHDEAAPLQGFQRGGERRAVHGERAREPPQCRRLRGVERHHQRELPIGEAERREGAVEASRQRAGGALRRKA